MSHLLIAKVICFLHRLCNMLAAACSKEKKITVRLLLWEKGEFNLRHPPNALFNENVGYIDLICSSVACIISLRYIYIYMI